MKKRIPSQKVYAQTERMDNGFFETILTWGSTIDYLTLDSKGNIYFVSENKIFKWHYDYDYTEPFVCSPITGRITWIYMVQDTDTLLLVVNMNSIYLARENICIFKAEKTIERMAHYKKDLLLIMDNFCFILEDYRNSSPTCKKIIFNSFDTDGIVFYADSIVDIQTNSSGLVYLKTLRGGYSVDYQFQYQGCKEIKVSQRICFLGQSESSIQPQGLSPIVFYHHGSHITYYEFSQLPLRGHSLSYFLITERIERGKHFFKRKSIPWKGRTADPMERIKWTDQVKSINADKDGNGIMLLPNSISRIQLYERSNNISLHQRDFARLYAQRDLSRDHLFDMKLDLPILSARLKDYALFKRVLLEIV